MLWNIPATKDTITSSFHLYILTKSVVTSGECRRIDRNPKTELYGLLYFRCLCILRSCIIAGVWPAPITILKKPRAFHRLKRFCGKRKRVSVRRHRGSNGEMCLTLGHNSGYGVNYHFIGSFEAHDVYGVTRDSDEDESH